MEWSLSKIVVLDFPSPSLPGGRFDADYTFPQIGTKEVGVDFSGIFGDLSSIAGTFAVAERIWHPHQITSPTGSSQPG